MLNKSDYLVTVIVPSFNRAHILSRTIPSYLTNDCVSELILIDDSSSDNTQEVVNELREKFPQIKYIKLATNSKQPFANNVGIDLATSPYIYFGDDDSFMLDGALDQLLQSMLEYNADIMGARALYLKHDSEVNNIEQFIRDQDHIKGEVCNLNNLTFNFFINTKAIIEVPVCHACLLVKSTIARNLKFDINYLGNAFREETDFVIRAKYLGYRIFFNPFVAQINLPRYMAKNGAHSMSYVKYRVNCFRNNWYFLCKNQHILKTLGVTRSIFKLQSIYLLETSFHMFAKFTPISLKKIIKKICSNL